MVIALPAALGPESSELTFSTLGAHVSTVMSVLKLSEPACSGAGNVVIAFKPSVLLIVAPLRSKAELAVLVGW